jgi:hypothetical protein
MLWIILIMEIIDFLMHLWIIAMILGVANLVVKGNRPQKRITNPNAN